MEKALYTLGEFTTNMQEFEIKVYLNRSLEICMAYLQGANQHHRVKFMALEALAPIITAAEHNIIPTRDNILQILSTTIQNSTQL